MREELEALQTRALQLELAVSGAKARGAIAGSFADALEALAEEIADRASFALEADAAKEGLPIAA
jgi:hypothetical protein